MLGFTRRRFAKLSAAAGLLAGGVRAAGSPRVSSSLSEKPALLGGKPVRGARGPLVSWPIVGDNDEKGWMEVLRKRRWNRLDGDSVKRFEQTWAQMLGAKYCLATANGTSALFASLNALGVGPGDEVIVPPYTFVATINVVLLQHALPVFVDTDPETYQIDARKIEAAITPRTRCILPVHLGGSAADLDTILEVARKHKLPVVEDACQSHLGEWRGRKLSTWGDLGCFSFQASKNLNCGEGGAVLSNHEELIRQCHSFHNNGRPPFGEPGFAYVRNGGNLRLTEFQGALLLEQLTRLEEQSRKREQNAAYLSNMLQEIPGIRPARMYEGCTRNAYHIYMMRYDPGQFGGLPRDKFLRAMRAEGIPMSGGYSPLNKQPFLRNTLESRAYRAIYAAKDLAAYWERIDCPVNDRVCETAVWMGQTTLLGSRGEMEQIVEAVRKTRQYAGDLTRA